MKDKFKFIMPADLEKSKDGDWKVKGLASTGDLDKQGEIIMQKGIDLSPIDNKKGIINFDHQKGPENTLGLLDGYSRKDNQLYVEGRLFKNHAKAKAMYEIMSSLGDSDRGRVGMSVEGQILERDPNNPKVIKKCRINAVALTLNPVNTNTYADLVKSLSVAEDIEFDSIEQEKDECTNSEPTFTASQVMSLMNKALAVGDGYIKPPVDRSGGDALAQENLDDEDDKKKKKKKMKKMSKDMYKSSMINMLDKLQILYPDNNRSEIWEAVKDRLESTFPKIDEKEEKN